MTRDGFAIRRMTRDELDIAVDWAAAEGWNPGLHDADAFFDADPDGYFAGLLDGELVASVSAVKYSPDYSFMGFFIVRPQYRGSTLGPRLAEHAFRHVGDAVAGLDGVLEQAERYAGIWGFEAAYHNQRYQGVASPARSQHPRIRPYTPKDLDAVEQYDRACFPAARRAFLERWLAQPDATVLLYRRGDTLGGYGMIRPAREGYRIGPLFADGPAEAEALFLALQAAVPEGAPVFIDVPQANRAALSLVEARNMKPMFETARMYRGGAPQIAINQVFGVTTLELG